MACKAFGVPKTGLQIYDGVFVIASISIRLIEPDA